MCGSSVALEPVKKVLLRCQQLESLNLSSCRALPRGMKRLYTGRELQLLKDSFDPNKSKAKEDNAQSANDKKTVTKTEADSKSESVLKKTERLEPETVPNSLSSSIEDEVITKSGESTNNLSQTNFEADISPDSKTLDSKRYEYVAKLSKDSFNLLPSPSMHSKPDSSSTPRSDHSKIEMGSPHFSPVSKPDSQVQNSPELQELSRGSGSWNLGQFKSTPSHKSEASPLNRLDAKMKHYKVIEQCSPTTSLDNKHSPENIQNIKQDIKNINNWNYGNYSPMPRQDGAFSQRSPYSARPHSAQPSPYSTQPSPAQPAPYSTQPSPAQPSPYSTQPSPYSAQPSPYSAQPSPYSSQPSPYSAQPSPDTSQMVKQDLQKSGQWNAGGYSPMPKHPAPFSPHPSPDPGAKADRLRQSPGAGATWGADGSAAWAGYAEGAWGAYGTRPDESWQYGAPRGLTAPAARAPHYLDDGFGRTSRVD